MKKSIIPVSRLMSLVLRHKPELAGLTLAKGGWAKCSELITGINCMPGKRCSTLTDALLKEIVETNDKKRFEYSEDGKMIRASQGHSVKIDLGLEEVSPPSILYHGTGVQTLDKIFKDGLLKMKRHHVHLSEDTETASKVGRRHGTPVVLEVSAGEMEAQRYKFYKSTNNVWLTDCVPRKYFRTKQWK